MPRTRIRFAYSDSDVAMIDRAREFVAAGVSGFGDVDPATESALLPADSSPARRASNSTLTGVVTAVRAAEAITHQLASPESTTPKGLR
jgi:hypothetical protein